MVAAGGAARPSGWPPRLGLSDRGGHRPQGRTRGGAGKCSPSWPKRTGSPALQLAFLDHVTCETRLAEIEPKIVSARPVHRHLPAALQRRRMPLSDGARHAVDGAGDGHRRATGAGAYRRRSAMPIPAAFRIWPRIWSCRRSTAASPRRPGPSRAGASRSTSCKYAPGQQYARTMTALAADNVSVRELTALIWLNDDFEGGETDFPKIKVQVRGGVGDYAGVPQRRATTAIFDRAHDPRRPAGDQRRQMDGQPLDPGRELSQVSVELGIERLAALVLLLTCLSHITAPDSMGGFVTSRIAQERRAGARQCGDPSAARAADRRLPLTCGADCP